VKIKDITEGWGDVFSNVAKDYVGMNRNDSWTGSKGLFPGIGKRKDAEELAHARAQDQASNPHDPIEPETVVQTQAGPTTAGAVLSAMKIAEPDPLVISYGKKLFHLNSTGDWAYLGSDNPIKDQTTAALLTKFADSQGV
jgi:hypothetical protein